MNVMAKKRATTWGGQLKALREAKGLKQWQAAKALGVPLRTYQNWEQGHRDAQQPRLLLTRMDQARTKARA